MSFRYFNDSDISNNQIVLTDSESRPESFIESIKRKSSDVIKNIKPIHIVVILIFILVLYYIKNNNINTYPVLKFLNNNIISIIITIVLIYIVFKYWDTHKKTIIIILIISLVLIYMIRDNVNSTETFKEILNNQVININNDVIDPNMYNVNTNMISPNGVPYLNNFTDKINYELPPMEPCSPDITNLIDIQNGDFTKLIGSDLEGNGNDFDLRKQEQIFGKIVDTKNFNNMGDIQGIDALNCTEYSDPNKKCDDMVYNKKISGVRDFLDNTNEKTVINNRKINNSIFDARDLSIQTNNGVKKMANISTNQICDGINCPKPEFMDM